MSIPGSLSTPTGPRCALPDLTRGASTVERMLRALDDALYGGRDGAGSDRTGSDGDAVAGEASRARPPAAARELATVLEPADPLRRCVACAVVSGAALGSAPLPGVGVVLVLAGIPSGRSPDLVALAVIAGLVLVGLALVLLGVRFAIVGLAAARSRVVIRSRSVRVRGVLREREIDWGEVAAVESRVVHPVHGLTGGLRLTDGSMVLLPILDRPLWEYSRPSGPQTRRLRRELHQRRARR